jgi:hypothetical protein
LEPAEDHMQPDSFGGQRDHHYALRIRPPTWPSRGSSG